MTNYPPAEVLLRNLPFSHLGGVKSRPALVILDTGDADVIVARITTQRPQSMFDVTLADWQGAGLLAPSIVRLHKLASLEKTLVQRKLGTLTAADRQHVAAVLPQLLAVWQSP
jgi:mRNA interferase MazF